MGRRTINSNLGKSQERLLWRVEPRVVNIKSGYRLDILTIWAGPSANSQGYYWKKSCLIEPSNSGKQTDNKNTFARLTCDRTSKFIMGSPPAQQ